MGHVNAENDYRSEALRSWTVRVLCHLSVLTKISPQQSSYGYCFLSTGPINLLVEFHPYRTEGFNLQGTVEG